MLNWILWIKTVWLKWIAWNSNVFDNDNETVLTFKLHAYAKLNYLKWCCFFDIETVLKTELFNIGLFWHLSVCKQNLYSRWLTFNWIVIDA